MSPAEKYTKFLFFLIALVQLGCGSNEMSDIELPLPAAVDSATPDQAQTSVVASNGKTDSLSPAEKPNQLPQPEAPPDEVCRKFLYSLNREDSDHFELLLTSAALSVATRSDFHLPPIAEPSATIRLGRPKFGTSREDICYVDCEMIDAEDLLSPELPMSWMLRKTKTGWRIAGMLISSAQSGGKAIIQPNLLSFESAADIQQIKDSLGQPVSTPATTEKGNN